MDCALPTGCCSGKHCPIWAIRIVSGTFKHIHIRVRSRDIDRRGVLGFFKFQSVFAFRDDLPIYMDYNFSAEGLDRDRMFWCGLENQLLSHNVDYSHGFTGLSQEHRGRSSLNDDLLRTLTMIPVYPSESPNMTWAKSAGAGFSPAFAESNVLSRCAFQATDVPSKQFYGMGKIAHLHSIHNLTMSLTRSRLPAIRASYGQDDPGVGQLELVDHLENSRLTKSRN